MGRKGRRRRLSGLTVIRRAVQVAFLVFFVFLAFKAAYPPLSTPPANIFLRFDPLAGLFSLLAVWSAPVAASFWPAWALLGLTLLGSRFFCGWICPLGTCFDIVGAVKPKALEYYRPSGSQVKELRARSKKGAIARRFRMKYVILAVVLALALAGVNLLYFASPLVIMNRSVYYVLLPQVPLLFIILMLLAFAYRPRFWCEEICPLGSLLGLCSLAGKKLMARLSAPSHKYGEAPRASVRRARKARDRGVLLQYGEGAERGGSGCRGVRMPAHLWDGALSPLSVAKDASACIDCGACYRDCPFGVDEPFIKPESGTLVSPDCTSCGACVSSCPAGGALSLKSFGLDIYDSRGKKAPASQVLPTSPAPPPSKGLTVTRREFVGSLSLGAVMLAGYTVGLRDLPEPVLRMPGAQDESAFLAECNRCGACTRTCPTGCIRPMGLEDGFQKLWTPRFYPRKAGCISDQCNQACARVCPAGAIKRREPDDFKIGTARVNTRTCLGYRGRLCLVCMERCRFEAIEADGLRPVIIEDECTGCGACENTCPTEPASIRIFAGGYSPAWPNGGLRRRGGRESDSRE